MAIDWSPFTETGLGAARTPQGSGPASSGWASPSYNCLLLLTNLQWRFIDLTSIIIHRDLIEDAADIAVAPLAVTKARAEVTVLVAMDNGFLLYICSTGCLKKGYEQKPKLSAVGPNFPMDMTWKRLTLVLATNGQKNNFWPKPIEIARGAGYCWLSGCAAVVLAAFCSE